MTTEWLVFFGSVIAALCGIMPATYAIYQGRKKVRIEEKDLEDQITERVLARARGELDRLGSENIELRKKVSCLEISSMENETLRNRVRELESQLKTLQAAHEDLARKYEEVCRFVEEQEDCIFELTTQLEENHIKPARKYVRKIRDQKKVP